MRRNIAILILGMGVVFGYGGAFAHATGHWRHHCGHWDESRWGRGERETSAPTSPSAPPQTVVVQPAPAAAPPAQVFVIMPGSTAQPAFGSDRATHIEVVPPATH